MQSSLPDEKVTKLILHGAQRQEVRTSTTKISFLLLFLLGGVRAYALFAVFVFMPLV